jgi:hypothetical protein
VQEGSFELNPVLQRPVDAFEWVILGFIPALVRDQTSCSRLSGRRCSIVK